MKPSRRRFLAAAPALIGLTAKAGRPIAGEFVNDAFPLGHRLRDHGRFAAPGRTEKVSVVVPDGDVELLLPQETLHVMTSATSTIDGTDTRIRVKKV